MVISACIACVCVSHFLGFTKPNNLLTPKPQILNSKPYTAHPPVQIGPKSWRFGVLGLTCFGVLDLGYRMLRSEFLDLGLGFRDFGFGAAWYALASLRR